MLFPLRVSFFFHATRYSNLCHGKSPHAQSNYCIGCIPAGVCVCACSGHAGWLEWMIEVLMWTSSVVALPLRSGVLSNGPYFRLFSSEEWSEAADFKGMRSGMMKGDIWCYPVDMPVCWKLGKFSAHLYRCVCVCVVIFYSLLALSFLCVLVQTGDSFSCCNNQQRFLFTWR